MTARRGPLLELARVSRHFGGLTAVRDVSLRVEEGEILSIIGPNGAGKTTLFNLITGVLPLSSGEVLLRGERLSGRRPHDVARRGVTRTFQAIQVFPEKTVLENVLVGRHTRVRSGLASALLRLPAFLREMDEHRERAAAALEVVGLGGRQDESAAELPTDAQQRLAIAMALASEPSLLLLDEPTGGLLEQEVAAMTDLVRRIRGLGITVILIEHRMRMVMQISDRVAVLNHGELIAEGRPGEVARHPRVVEAYLGRDDAAVDSRT